MSDEKPDDPQLFLGRWSSDAGPVVASEYWTNITLRDLFAATALNGLLAARTTGSVPTDLPRCAKWSYQMADAMLAEREKGRSDE